MTPTVEQITAEIKARVAANEREAKGADDPENVTAKSCQHTAQELERLRLWIEGTK